MKICKMCLHQKSDIEFGKNSKRKDKLNSYCKSCCSNKSKEYRSSKPERWEKQKQKNKVSYRLMKGIPIDAPDRYKPKDGTPYINSSGYLEMRGNKWKGHACSDKYGRVLMHRLIISEYLGRNLKKEETVHHKNGDTLDNRIENLEVWSSSHPPGQRIEDKINWAIEFLNQYGYIVNKK